MTAPASRCHFIPVLHCETPAVAETTSSHGQTGKRRIEHFPVPHRECGTSFRLNWKEHNRHLPFAEDWKRFFSTVHTALHNTWYNDYVMRSRSYSRGLRNRKTYANANSKSVHWKLGFSAKCDTRHHAFWRLTVDPRFLPPPNIPMAHRALSPIMNAPDTEVQQLWDYVCLITTVDIISTQPCATDWFCAIIDRYVRSLDESCTCHCV